MINFEDIKEVTHGYLDKSIYERIYKYAKENDKDGIVLEIGPGQGASTICFAMAMQENKHILKIVSIDKFYGSAALKYVDNIEENINVIKNNIDYFNLTPYIEFIPFDKVKEDCSDNISLLFIDADGAIDRDFRRYFNNITSEGIIIIDDYEKGLNLQARTRFLKMHTIKSVNSFLYHNNIKKIEEYSFLGKQYLTYSIVNYLVDRGFIEIVENLNGTIFCKKKDNASIYSIDNEIEIYQLRKKQSELYLIFRNMIADTYKKIDSDLLKIMEDLDMANAIVYSCYYYEIKKRMQMSKVYEVHKDINNFIQDDFSIQDIDLETLSDVDFCTDTYVLADHKNVISHFIYKEGYSKTVYIMLKKENILQGIAILYDNNYNDNVSGKEIVDHITKLRNTFCSTEEVVDKILLKIKELM